MKNVFRRLGMLIESRRVLVMVISLLLIVPVAWGASQIETNSGIEMSISTDSQVYKDYDRFTDKFSDKTVVILVEGDSINDLLQPQNVSTMEWLEDKIGENPLVLSTAGPAFIIKQALAAETESPRIPNNQETLTGIVIDPETGDVRPRFAGVFPDSQHALIAVVLDSGAEREDLQEAVIEIESIVDNAGFTGVDTIVTGELVLSKEMNQLMGKSMGTMLIVAILLMLIILGLIFRVRNFFTWRWMPLGVVLIAMVYTFGITGFLSVPISTVTMASLPVLIGLGADYAIQFHNRYDEEARRGETFAEALIDSVTHIGPAIGMAIVVACLGFTALFFSPVPMIQDFGLTLIIGVVCCYILSLFFLTAILYWHDHRKTSRAAKQARKTTVAQGEDSNFVEKALGWLAPRVISKPAIILPIAVLLCGIGLAVDERIDTETDIVKFLASDLEVVENLETLETVAGGRSSASLFVEADDVTDPQILTWIGQVEEVILQEQAGIVYATNSVTGLLARSNGGELPSTSEEAKAILQTMPMPVKGNLVTEDFSAANVVVNLPGMNSEEIKELKADLEAYVTSVPAGAKVTVTSGVIMQDKVIGGLSDGRVKMTIIGLIFVFAGLFVLFRFRVIRALIATAPIALIIGWSAIMMYLMGIDYNPITATMGALIIGIGVEFTILLMTRYYEEREKGERPTEAMVTAMTKIGRAVIASGLTVVGGFAALLIARDFPIMVDFGIVTLINMMFALVSTLLVLPPLIVWIDSRTSVTWPINLGLFGKADKPLATEEVSITPARNSDNWCLEKRED